MDKKPTETNIIALLFWFLPIGLAMYQAHEWYTKFPQEGDTASWYFGVTSFFMAFGLEAAPLVASKSLVKGFKDKLNATMCLLTLCVYTGVVYATSGNLVAMLAVGYSFGCIVRAIYANSVSNGESLIDSLKTELSKLKIDLSSAEAELSTAVTTIKHFDKTAIEREKEMAKLETDLSNSGKALTESNKALIKSRQEYDELFAMLDRLQNHLEGLGCTVGSIDDDVIVQLPKPDNQLPDWLIDMYTKGVQPESLSDSDWKRMQKKLTSPKL